MLQKLRVNGFRPLPDASVGPSNVSRVCPRPQGGISTLTSKGDTI